MAADLTDYRLGRQLRSASAAATMSAPCKPNSVGPDTQVMLTWRTVSPSAWLMVDPRNGARAVIRDTGAQIGRFLWSVLAAGEMAPISAAEPTYWHKPSRAPRRASAHTPETNSRHSTGKPTAM